MILGILQARVSSTRLPGKVLKPILGKPMLARQIERLLRSRRIEQLVLATSTSTDDAPLAELATAQKVHFYGGKLDDVLDRFYQAAMPFKPEHIVRLTGDCPLADASLIDEIIDFHVSNGFDYTTNAMQATYPDGLDVEVVRFAALTQAWQEATLASDREHVLPFISGKPERFKQGHFKGPTDLSHLRWTVDEPDDFELVRKIYEALYPGKPDFTTADILKLLAESPDLISLNNHFIRNEGYKMSLGKDKHSNRYRQSEAMLERALKHIPLGSQTFSKSKTQYPMGVSPYFMKKAKGSRTWDVDGNEYIDFVNGLCSVTLGHCDPDVNKAVREQLDDGVIFSLPHPLEQQVAEKICEMVPSAQMVRFGKNGSDATAGAIRLARAFTGRDRVAVCGYHGWQDWYIGSTARNLGVPRATRDLTHTFSYNDIESLNKLFADFPGQIAAVILEPMNVTDPKPGFLESVKELTHKNGAVLIFDEIVTGFRYANGGAQALFKVTPDLTTLGKGMANGYPVSAVAGRADIMRLMEEIFFSFTFGGETLSLAASLASLSKLQREPVIATMKSRGEQLLTGIRGLIEKHKLESICSVAGHPCWSFLLIKDAAPYTAWQLKTLYLQEVFARGLLTITTHNLSYAHTEADVNALLSCYEAVLPLLKAAVENKDLESRLLCQPLQPLFKVR